MSKRNDLPWFTADWPTRKKRRKPTRKFIKSEPQTKPLSVLTSEVNPLPTWGKAVFILALIFAIGFILFTCVGIQSTLPDSKPSIEEYSDREPLDGWKGF